MLGNNNYTEQKLKLDTHSVTNLCSLTNDKIFELDQMENNIIKSN